MFDIHTQFLLVLQILCYILAGYPYLKEFFEMNLNLFGTIPVKEIDVNVIPRTTVVPLGNLIGVKMYTSGVLVVGMSEIEGVDKKMYKPYISSGIKEGDEIEIENLFLTNKLYFH